MLSEFEVKLFIDNGKEGIQELSKLNENEKHQWKIDLEERALSVYYNLKVKITHKKI